MADTEIMEDTEPMTELSAKQMMVMTTEQMIDKGTEGDT